MTEAEAMEADVEVVREFQEHVENSRPGRRGVYIVQSKADDLDAALTRISDRLIEVTGERNTAQYERDMLAHSRDDYADRLQRYEAALRFYAESSDNYMTAQAALAGMSKEEFRTAEARRDAATQEAGE